MNEREPFIGEHVPLSDKQQEMLADKKKNLSEDEYNKFLETFYINNQFEFDYCMNFAGIRAYAERIVENINTFLYTPHEYEDSPFFKEMFRDPDEKTQVIIDKIKWDIIRIDGMFKEHEKLMKNPEKVT